MSTKLKAFLIGLSVLLFASTANAVTILPVSQGGTGWGNPGGFTAGVIPFGNGLSPLATSSSFTFNNAGSRLTVTNATTTNLSVILLWLPGQSAGCAQFDGNAKLTSTGVNCGTGGGSGSWPFTTTDTNFGVAVQSTTTPEWFKTPASGIFSIMASSTTWLQYASTTALSATTICLTGDTCRTTWPSGSSVAWGAITGTLSAQTDLDAALKTKVGTSTNAIQGNLAYWTGFNTLGNVGTSTLSASAPLTGSFTQFGAAGSIGIQAATAAQAGYETQNEFNYVHTATTTFSAPLVYTLGTNAVTCTNASNGVTGCMSAVDWGLLHTATTTFSSPLSYSVSTNAVTCPTCNTSSASVTSVATTWPIIGGTITTSGTLTFGGIATSAAPTIGNLAYWTSDRLLGTVATTSVTCSGTVSCTGFNVLGSSPITITGSGGGGADPFTHTSVYGQTTSATSTLLALTGSPFSLVASSTAEFVNASTTLLTAFTKLYVPYIANYQLLETDGSGALLATTSIGTNLLTQHTISGIELGGTLANLSATDNTLTFSGTYTGATARTIGINLANPNSWTGLQTIAAASTTNLTASNYWQIGQSAGCAQFDSNAKLTSTGVNCGTGGGGSWPFTTSDTTFGTAVQSTTTPEWFKGNGTWGLFASSTSEFANSSTTLATVFTKLYVPYIANYQLLETDGSGGLLATTSIGYSMLTGTPTIPAGANPTASLGLSAINGVSTSFMRADAAPALDQTISPAWTGVHKFSNWTYVGTSTNAVGELTVGSSTAPQIHLSDNSGGKGFFMRWFNNTFTIGTTTASATSTPAIFSIDTSQPGGSMSIGSTTMTFPAANGLLTIGTNNSDRTSGTSTISAGKIQIDGYNTTGSRICLFVVGTTLTIGTGGCTQ